jgi:uncharacterized protein
MLAGLAVPEPVDEAEAERAAAERAAERRSRRRRPSRPRTWIEGGTTVQHWGWELLGWAVVGLGAGLVASAALTELVPAPLGPILALAAVWIAFAAPVILAFTRSRPRALLRFRPIDLLWGLGLGSILRLTQGWLEMAAGGTGAWPTYGSTLPSGWVFDQLVAAVFVAPVLEEFFFRGLVLVAVYTGARRLAGRGVAGFAAVLVSTALFLMSHTLLAEIRWDGIVSLTLVGLVASLVVLLTGRIWGAVLLHVTYNGLWVGAAAVGTMLSGAVVPAS